MAFEQGREEFEVRGKHGGEAGGTSMMLKTGLHEAVENATAALQEAAVRTAEIRAIAAVQAARLAALRVAGWPEDPRRFLPGYGECGVFPRAANLLGDEPDLLLELHDHVLALTATLARGCTQLLGIDLASKPDLEQLLDVRLHDVEGIEREAVGMLQEALRAAAADQVRRVAPTATGFTATRAEVGPWLEIARISDHNGHTIFDWTTADEPIAINCPHSVLPAGTRLKLDECSPLTGAPVIAAVAVSMTEEA